MEVPVYLFTGLMDSGKTSLIKETLFDSEFSKGLRALLILCEDGEEEYDEEELKARNIYSVYLQKEEELTSEALRELQEAIHPEIVFIEYNGTWQIATIKELTPPKDWTMVQVMTTIAGPTYEMYMQNMLSMMLEQIFMSDVIIVNRADDSLPKMKIRAQLKTNNKRAQIVFELPDGTIDEEAMNAMPFDKEAKFIDLAESDYAMFIQDIMENPKDYNGKEVRFRAWIMKPPSYKGAFVPGRRVMTCCEADIRFMGLYCKSKRADTVKNQDWINLTAKVRYEWLREYGRKGPVLYEEKIERAEKPADEIAYF